MNDPDRAARARPLRLLHFFPSFAFGGQQVRLALLAKSLGDAYAHHIISLGADISAAHLMDAQVDALTPPKSSFVSVSALTELKAAIRESDPDIVCTYNWGSIEAVIANRIGPRKPHIHFEDGFGPDESVDRQLAKRAVFRRLALGRSIVVTPSKTLERLALEKWRLSPQKVRYIANGVSIERFSVPARVYDRGSFVIGSVGALRPEKNFRRLLRAVKEVSEELDMRLSLVGDGPETDLLKQEAASLGLNVEMPGATSEPETAYASFDLFVMSSDTEQMPLSLIEAMAAGLPVVATDVGDIRHMVSEENKRFITPREDEGALSASIAELAAAPALRAQLGRANAKKAADDYSLEKMAAQYDALFRSLNE